MSLTKLKKKLEKEVNRDTWRDVGIVTRELPEGSVPKMKHLLRAIMPLLREILVSDEYNGWFQKEKPFGLLEDEVFLNFIEQELLGGKK